MSASMYANRPRGERPMNVHVDHTVHRKIAPRIFGHDGTASDSCTVVDCSADHAYLAGMHDAYSEGSIERTSLRVILDMIERYGSVELEIRR